VTNATLQPLSLATALPHDPALQVTGYFNKTDLEQKVKPKTRGTSEPIQDERTLAPTPGPIAHTIQVDKQTYKVIKVLFHIQHEDTSDLARAIKWDDFKRAMMKLGFSVQQLRGSAWQFLPSASDGRGILFHEPHPGETVWEEVGEGVWVGWGEV